MRIIEIVFMTDFEYNSATLGEPTRYSGFTPVDAIYIDRTDGICWINLICHSTKEVYSYPYHMIHHLVWSDD